jgi:hypothetical protein
MRALLLIALGLSLSAEADTPEFATLTEAAMAGLALSAQTSPYYEYGGQILLLPNGKYAYATPETTYEGDHMAVSQDPDDYQRGKIVAHYHTHPCLPYSHIIDKFSDGDLRSYRIVNRPGYMLDMCTGDVHFWAPGDSVDTRGTFSETTIEVHKTSVGKIVGHIPVPGKPLEAK